MFSKQWFNSHQAILLRFANTWLGKKILRIDSKEKLIGILPNAIFWRKGKKYVAEFRTHDKYAKRLFYSFKPLWYLFHLWDMVWYPKFNLGFDTFGPVYPAAGANSPVDGEVNVIGKDEAFATLRAESGSAAGPTAAQSNIGIRSSTTSNQFSQMYRFVSLFDTSTLTSNASISDAVYSVYGNGKANNLGSLNLAMIASNPANTNNLVAGDFGTCVLTRQADTDITYAGFSTTGYNNFTLNATGRGNISKTGITKFGAAIANDVDNSAPAWISNVLTDLIVETADNAGTTVDPKLVVTYTLSSSGTSNFAYFM